MDDLKPCPFCGSVSLDADYSDVIDGKRGGVITCSICSAEGPFVTALVNNIKEAATTAWNRREYAEKK